MGIKYTADVRQAEVCGELFQVGSVPGRRAGKCRKSRIIRLFSAYCERRLGRQKHLVGAPKMPHFGTARRRPPPCVVDQSDPKFANRVLQMKRTSIRGTNPVPEVEN